MRHFAVIGSGPAGFYTAEALAKAYGDAARIDIIDKLPVPYGLIRFGVAPDHQSIKAVSRRYDKVVEERQVGFVGNVAVGDDVSIDELKSLYDAVILATGAPNDRQLGIPGEDLPGVVGSAAFVGWYNGHPDFADLDPPLDGEAAAVIGNGNVALDVARILSKTRAEFAGSDIVGHALDALDHSRDPHHHLRRPARPAPDRDDPQGTGRAWPPRGRRARGRAGRPAAERGRRGARSRACASRSRTCANSPRTKTRASPSISTSISSPARCAIEGEGRAERLIVERTALDEAGQSVGTGETYAIPASLIVSCIGYHTPRIDGVPYDDRGGRFANDGGVIGDGLYCVGWARRGPSGTIGTNRPDGYEVAEAIAAALPAGSDGGKQGGEGLRRC